MNNFLFLFILSFIACVKSSNILFISDIASPSHHIFNSALARELAARGNNVTFVSADNVNDLPENLHYIHLEYQYKSKEEFYDSDKGLDINDIINMPDLLNIAHFNGYGFDTCTEISMNKGFETIKNYPDNFQFDLLIYDYSAAPCFLGLLPKFKYPPVIGITAFCNPSRTVDILGGDKLGLTVKPHYLLDYDWNNLNIYQRLKNAFYNCFESAFRKYYGMPSYDRQMKEMFGDNLPYAEDLEKLMQIALVNTHPSIDFAESLPPNVIQVGGLHISETKPLEHDIDEFLKRGKKGSVLMSLGSNFRSDTLGIDKIKAIVETFRQLSDYNFIWKFESLNMLKELPSNVIIKPWLFQNDILAHENIKAFISHSGMLSTQEATWHGVPIVGIPLYVDQIRNLRNSIKNGVAVKVDYKSITVDNLKNALLEILENPKYKNNMKVRSKLFKDQPEKPLDRAVWWCQYIMRNPKSTHLRPAEFNLGFFGSHFWDVQVLIIALIVMLIYVAKKMLKRIFLRNIDKIKKNN